MILSLLLVGIIMITCIITNKISSKVGISMLLVFILLGMFFGSDGMVKIHFDNFEIAEQICSIALIFIMFYGGFGTKWSKAKPIANSAILLSSLGTVFTALFVGLFCFIVLKMELLVGLLIGAVISSTDAASVFSILRSKQLNLKYNTASLLEVESGSNDPFSYMLTLIVLSMMTGQSSVFTFTKMLLAQIIFGIGFGFLIAYIVLFFLKHIKLSSSGFNSTFFVAISIISYALPSLIGGNGYLSAYIAGIVLGNRRLRQKQELVHFFDGLTNLMQMLLFFLLGLLSFPSLLPHIMFPAFMIALFLTFIARPLMVTILLSPFKCPINQQLLVSWSGMRGAASIVFAIMSVIHPANIGIDIFHIVFFIVLFSILIQGSLIPLFAKKLEMIDDTQDVMKTFTDFEDQHPISFCQAQLPHQHPWTNCQIKEITLPPNSLIVLIIRNGQRIIPEGKTYLYENDMIVFSGFSLKDENESYLHEIEIEANDPSILKPLMDTPFKKELVVLIKRDTKVIIPRGDTLIKENDILVVTNKEGT